MASQETRSVGHDQPRSMKSRLKMEPVVGIEPTTDGLQNRCSTTELNWPRLTCILPAANFTRQAISTEVSPDSAASEKLLSPVTIATTFRGSEQPIWSI
jgi:hypothetical protein